MDVNSYYQLHIDPHMKSWNLMKYIINPAGILSIFFAFELTYLINHPVSKSLFFFSNKDVLTLFFWILPFWLIIIALIKITGIPAKRHKVLIFLYLQSTISIFFLLAFFDYVLKLNYIPHLFLAELSVFAFFFLYYGRMILYRFFKFIGIKGFNHINAVIVADDKSLPMVENLIVKKELGYHIVVIFTESELIKSKFENFAIILPGKFLGILKDLIKVDFIDEVLYMLEEPEPSSFREILSTCEDLGVTLRLKSKSTNLNLSSAVKTDIANGSFLSFDNIPNNSYAMAIRKTMDINIALLMIVVLFPVLVLLSLLIKMTSKGPVLSKLPRTGWRGQQIKVYRFRTSIAEKGYEEYQDGGIQPPEGTAYTRIGKFLLMSGLDQLPQLFNVLKGEIPIILYRQPLQKD